MHEFAKQRRNYKENSCWCRSQLCKGTTSLLTWAGVLSIHKCWFLHKIFGPKIFSVVVQLASLVTRIVVQTLTRWLRGTRYVTRHQIVNMQWFKCVVNKSKSAFWIHSVAARFSSCPQQSTKQHTKITYAQNCHVFELYNVAESQYCFKTPFQYTFSNGIALLDRKKCKKIVKGWRWLELEVNKTLTQCCQVSDNQDICWTGRSPLMLLYKYVNYFSNFHFYKNKNIWYWPCTIK